MAKANKVYTRLGLQDIVLTQEQAEKLSGYHILYDENGKEVVEFETYLIGYEDEDGNECEENGEYLN